MSALGTQMNEPQLAGVILVTLICTYTQYVSKLHSTKGIVYCMQGVYNCKYSEFLPKCITVK